MLLNNKAFISFAKILGRKTQNTYRKSFSTRFKDKVAIVTGGSQGIGRAIVRQLSSEGAHTVIADINDELGEKTAEQLKNCQFIHCDTSKQQDIKKMVERVHKTKGQKLDILVNNAARFIFGNLKGSKSANQLDSKLDAPVSTEQWAQIINTNVLGYAKCIQYCVQKMKKNPNLQIEYNINEQEGLPNKIIAKSKGVIVNVISVSGYIAQPNFVPYNMSKGALMQLTRCCALDLAEFNIRVNSVCPGSIETKASYNHMKMLDLSIENGRKQFGEESPMKRQGAPEEVARAVAFLASQQDSSFINGSSIVVDGGITMK